MALVILQVVNVCQEDYGNTVLATKGTPNSRASFRGGGTCFFGKFLPPLNYRAMCLHTQTFTPSPLLLS